MGESLPWLAFFIGVSISIDVLFGTVANFKDTSLSFKNWSLPLMIFHIILLLVGSYLLWTAVELDITNERVVATIGFGLISWLVVDLLWQALTSNTLPYGPNWLAIKAGVDEESSSRILAMLAVSFDALFVGLANPANNLSMFLVAIIAGAVVAICTQAALLVARMLRSIQFAGHKMTAFNIFGSFCSITAINTFGIMALSRACSQEAGLLHAATLSALIIGIVYIVTFRQLWRNETMKH